MTIREAVNKIESLVGRDIELARRIEDMKNNLMKRGKKKYLITVARTLYLITKLRSFLAFFMMFLRKYFPNLYSKHMILIIQRSFK